MSDDTLSITAIDPERHHERPIVSMHNSEKYAVVNKSITHICFGLFKTV